jgi:hypothetical protein
MSKDSALQKMVVRTRDGEVIPGFANPDGINNTLKIITQQGKEQTFSIDKLKAIFFVKDFQGNPEYDEIKFLSKQAISSMIWARVEFFDGEVLEGKIPNNMELLSSPGFYLSPSDQDTNNKRVYVVKSALKTFIILNPV